MRQAVFPDAGLISAPQKAVFISSDVRSGVQPIRLSLRFRPSAIHGERLACLQLLQASQQVTDRTRQDAFFCYRKHRDFRCFSIPSQEKVTLTLKDGEPAASKQPKG